MIRNATSIGALLMGVVVSLMITPSLFGDQEPLTPTLTIVYPKHNAAVGKRVNLVLDPTTDWSRVPFFQVSVGATNYPVVDTSTGRHAVQGLLLQPGLNSITVKALSPLVDAQADAGKNKNKESGGDLDARKFRVLIAQTISVYNREGAFAAVPAMFQPQFFHTRAHEADCSMCHRLEAETKDYAAAKSEDVLCYTCHRSIPSGKYIHGPAAVWNCLACHNPELYPVKYQFTSIDPWTVTKSSRSVEPAVFSISADSLFLPRSASLVSADVPRVPRDRKRSKQKTAELIKAREAELKKRKEREREFFSSFLEYVRQNPTDRIRVEVHADSTPLPKLKGAKAKGFKTLKQMTTSQAWVITRLLKEYGITGKNRVVTVGMGDALPKAPNTTAENKELNRRIELVVYPVDVKVVNSLKLPVLKDRERVTVSIAYSRGAAAVKGLKVIERLPRGLHYAKGTGVVQGRVKDPQVKGEALVWMLGDPGTDFQEMVTFVVKKDKGVSASVSPISLLRFTVGASEESREFDPLKPYKGGLSVKETCDKCHEGLMSGPVKHGPADAGDCTLCHDPHGSNYPAWTRKQSWRLCTTCHAEKAKDVHVIAGFVYGVSHPTRKWHDPSRPGKRLSCISCHSPHSGESDALLAYGLRTKYELCGICHGKK